MAGMWPPLASTFGGPDQSIWRVDISNRKKQRMMGLREIPQSGATAFVFSGMAPDDAPLASVIRANADIYELGLDLP
jgi:hypothetical protein